MKKTSKLFKKKFEIKNLDFLYLLLLSFVFITSCALALNNETLFSQVEDIVPQVEGATRYSDLPVLSEDAGFPILSAQSVMAVDLNSGVTLYEKDPLKPLLPASTTKIVTALVALDKYNLSDVITVGNVDVVGQKMGLVRGERLTIKDLLDGMLIYSANDAAEVLAQIYPGGRDEFVDQMNEKVTSLGLVNSHFSNPAGLDSADQYSNVRDLIAVSKFAMQNPTFSEIVGTKEKTIKSQDGRIVHNIININELLGVVDGVKGVKTGWTEAARENLVTYIERDGKRIMIAVLGSQDRFGETKELIDWIYDNYSWQEVKYSYSP